MPLNLFFYLHIQKLLSASHVFHFSRVLSLSVKIHTLVYITETKPPFLKIVLQYILIFNILL